MNDILIVYALSEEFPFKDYNSVVTGVGKVNATLNLYSCLIEHTNIKLVVNVGTAGGVLCNKNEVIECGIFEDGQLEYPGFEGEVIEFDYLRVCDGMADVVDSKSTAERRGGSTPSIPTNLIMPPW